ncbi:MAG: pyridoxamine 5'-phosphate oxidase family protein [Actinomycetia bacterium]|nr:pyridoxamine 5'-phosphate oxidase family protein [Actinomycetes bacterium]
MSHNENPISVLDEARAWDLLAGQQVGRLATSLDRMPEIFPVNFALDGESIVFRTAEGSKLVEVVLNEQVAFEVDGWDDNGGWSVVARGAAEVIQDADGLSRAEALPLRPWVPTVKSNFVRIQVESISGRSFVFGPDPIERYRYGHNRRL